MSPVLKFPSPKVNCGGQSADVNDSMSINHSDFTNLIRTLVDVNQRYGAKYYLEHAARLLTPDESLTHTLNHVDCPACAKMDRDVTTDLLSIGSLTFDEAFERWKGWRAMIPSIRPRTHETDSEYANALSKFFGKVLLSNISAGQLAAYQHARKANAIAQQGRITRPWKHPASHAHINHELGLLQRMLRACKQWDKLDMNYHPLPLKSWSPREILSEHEEVRLYHKAAGNPEAELAYLVAIISTNTTATGIELRGLQLGGIRLTAEAGKESTIYISEEYCKNSARPRTIPLNEAALFAVRAAMKRAFKLGCKDLDDFLFPFRIGPGKYDPKRPASRWFLRNSWDKLREITGFHDLRPHDMRHLAITKMLEAGVDGNQLNSISGHISERMREYYSHVRVRCKMEALSRIEPSFDMQRVVSDGRRRYLSEQQEKPKGKRSKNHRSLK